MTSLTPNPTHKNEPESRIKRWSFSGLQTYEKCPLAAKKQYLDKLPRRGSPQADRGNQVHQDIELFINGQQDELKEKINKTYINELTDFRTQFLAGDVFVEEPWGYNADWQFCGFEHEDVWVRGLLDLGHIVERIDDAITVLHGYDWKTGKRYPPKHLQQEQLYAVFAFAKIPTLVQFDFSFVYLDEQKPWDQITTKRSYTRERAKQLEESFTRRGLRMTMDTTFKPQPNVINCKYCDYNDSCEWAVK